MKISVVICSVGRPAVLHDTVVSITKQETVPQHILIVSPSTDHLLPETLALPGVIYIQSALGATIQRNKGLDHVPPDVDMIAFLDDDMELCRTFLTEMCQLLETYPEVLIACGTLLRDGGRGTKVSREEARQLCEAEDAHPADVTPQTPGAKPFIPLASAYGCSMIARASTARGARFDERLPLYAWLEDADFAFRVTRGGPGLFTSLRAKGVHLGWRGGRVSGVRFGFSQMINPFYLWKKAKVFSLPHVIVQFWLRCMVGNILGVLIGDKEYDRAGYLRGNLIGIKHLLSGKCDPTRILQM